MVFGILGVEKNREKEQKRGQRGNGLPVAQGQELLDHEKEGLEKKG